MRDHKIKIELVLCDMLVQPIIVGMPKPFFWKDRTLTSRVECVTVSLHSCRIESAEFGVASASAVLFKIGVLPLQNNTIILPL